VDYLLRTKSRLFRRARHSSVHLRSSPTPGETEDDYEELIRTKSRNNFSTSHRTLSPPYDASWGGHGFHGGGLSRRLPFPVRLPCIAGLRRPDGQTSRTLSYYLAKDSPRSSIYSPATDQVLPKHEAGGRLGNVNQLSAHALVTALNCIIRISADGQIIQKLCTIEAIQCSLVPLQVSNLRKHSMLF
jgi:hypothetical protein